MIDKIYFKFLSGDKIGSKLNLACGSYLLGNTDECEIRVNTTDNDKFEILIEINDKLEVFVSLRQGKALLDQKELDNNKTLFNEGSLLSFKLTTLIYFKDVNKLDNIDLKTLIQYLYASKTQDNNDNNTDVQQKALQDASLQDEAKTTQALSHDIQVQNKRYFLYLILGLVILALLLSSLMFGSLLYGKDKDLYTSVNKIENYLTSNKAYKNLKVTTEDDLIVIDGILLDQKELKIFTDNMPKLSIASVINIKTIENTLKAIERSFAMRDAFIKAVYNQTFNTIEIYGYFKDKYTLGHIYNLVKDELPNYNLNFKVTYQDKLQTYLEDKLLAYNLPLKLVFNDTKLSYQANLSVEEIQALTSFKDDVQTYINAPFILESVNLQQDSTNLYQIATNYPKTQDINTQNANIDDYGFKEHDIIGVTLNPMRFISLQDGSKLFEGSVLKSGYTIKHIDIDKIVLHKDGRDYFYELK